METHAILLYKCRRCGTTFEGDHRSPEFSYPLNSPFKEHHCICIEVKDPLYGVADLIGWSVREGEFDASGKWVLKDDQAAAKNPDA